MNIRSRWLSAMFIVVLSPAEYVYAALATAIASAEVISPISVITTRNLTFGKMLAGSNGGQVTLSADDSRSNTGSVQLVANASTAARFMLVGQANSTYAISLPANTTINDRRGNSITIVKYQSYPARTGLLDHSGKQEIRVGGTLQLAPEQNHGFYSGQFSVVVEYN